MFLHNGVTKIVLLGYQQKAVTKVNEFLNGNLGFRDDTRRLFLLQAPTGAGKTVIAGDIIAQNARRNVAFLWMSPAKGGLALQSHASLKRMLPASGVDVEYGTPDVIAAGEILKPNSVTVMNWSLVDKDSNRATKDGEKCNIYDIAAQRSNEGVEVVILIDEAHYASKTGKKARAFKARLAEALGYTPITLEVTATPDSIDKPSAAHEETERHYIIDTAEVVDAGMISKGVRVNPDFKRFQAIDPTRDAAEVALRAGLARQQIIREELTIEGAGWDNPLLLVQIPDGKAGKEYQEQVEQILALPEFDITVANGRLGRYMSDNKTDLDELDEIAKFTSKIDVLIFKQGVALGWDCPRAKILVAHRDSKNEIFKVQTIGRIVRMPERKHYTNEILNYAYIFTNLESSLFDVSENGVGQGYINDVFVSPREGAPLPTDFMYASWSRADAYNDLKPGMIATAMGVSTCKASLAAVAAKLDSLQKKAVITSSVITDVEIGAEAFFETGSQNAGDSTLTKMSSIALDAAYRKALAEMIPDSFGSKARSVGGVDARYRAWFAQNTPSLSGASATEIKHAAMSVLLYSGTVRKAWEQVLEACTLTAHPASVPTRKPWEQFTFAPVMPVSSDKGVEIRLSHLADTYLYVDDNGTPWLESRKPSKPEDRFMKEFLLTLQREERLVWWWKNGETGQFDTSLYFHIPNLVWRNNGGNNTCPDFIICYLSEDGETRFAVLEVKASAGDLSAFSDTSRLKAQTLKDWSDMVTSHTVAGVVYETDGKWMLATTDNLADDAPLLASLV